MTKHLRKWGLLWLSTLLFIAGAWMPSGAAVGRVWFTALVLSAVGGVIASEVT